MIDMIEAFLRTKEEVSNGRDNDAQLELLSFPFVIVDPTGTRIQEAHEIDAGIEHVHQRNLMLGTARTTFKMLNGWNPEATCPLVTELTTCMDAHGHALQAIQSIWVLRRQQDGF